MKIAVVQKCPSNVNYEKQLGLENLTVFNMSSEKVTRLLKKDVDLVGFNPNDWDWVILVGSEAVKNWSKATAVTDYTGKILPGKNGETNLIACISPAMLAFKPENKPVFEATVQSIHKIINGKGTNNLNLEIGLITEYDRAVEHLKFILNMTQGPVGLDSETTSLAPRNGHILGLSISYRELEGRYIVGDVLDAEVCTLLQQIIETRPVVLHNAKFDMKFFSYHLGLDFSRALCVHDTMIQHYLLDERQGTHGLKSLTMKYGRLGDYDRDLEEFKDSYCKSHGVKKEDFTYDLIPLEIIWKYAALDTAATLELHNKFLPIIEKNPKLKSCYYNLMLPALHFLTRMEERGIPVSKDRLLAAKSLLLSRLDEDKKELYKFEEVLKLESDQGSAFNPNSVQQLRKLLFDYLNLPVPNKLTATGAISTDADVLLELSSLHRVPELILSIKKNTKLINTYVDKLIPALDMDGRVRTGFNLTSTTSGRLSSSGNFNFQQLPSRDYLIKGCLKAPKGYKYVAWDMGTAEVWIAAALSGDKNMQKIFTQIAEDPDKYPDFHSTVAHSVYSLPCEPNEVKKQYPALRQAAKAISFSLLYGSGPANVAETINLALIESGQQPTCTVEDAKGYFKDYYARFPQLKRWIDKCHSEIKESGYIYSFFGRKRRLHNINSVDRGVAAGEVRSGFNAIIQSTSSDILLLGAIDADIEIMESGLDAEIIGLVHDSIVGIVREDQVDLYNEIIVRNVQKDRGLMIPGAPMGMDEDTEPGGSEDYSGGKMKKDYPEVAAI